jgi:peptidoglycan/xylan/chitin deacetylase (PgdA/CDA1 family)
MMRRQLILLYHRILPSSRADNIDHHLAVSVEEFSAQMDILLANAKIMPLIDLIQPRRQGQENDLRKEVAITFDDGYADLLLHALPVLAERQIPASLFLTTGFVQGSNAAWWDSLADAVRRDNKPPEIQARYYRKIEKACRHRSFECINKKLVNIYGRRPEEHIQCRDRYVDWNDISALDASHISIENHTHRHEYLSHLTEAEAENDIARANELIYRHTSKYPQFFAYPGGGIRDIPSWSARLLQRMNFITAFAAGPVSRLCCNSYYKSWRRFGVPILARREVIWQTERKTFQQWVR